jgi:hypothetical protein
MDIAGAAIRETIQMSLTSVPFEVFLEQLLVPNDPWFCGIGQLGKIREARTALSGLFGRFVARAHLRRHHGFHCFEPIKAELKPLTSWPRYTVRKNDDGDLPDWIVATAAGANTFAVAEAKGSHNLHGPKLPLAAAKKQAARIDILRDDAPITVKRYAVARSSFTPSPRGTILRRVGVR